MGHIVRTIAHSPRTSRLSLGVVFHQWFSPMIFHLHLTHTLLHQDEGTGERDHPPIRCNAGIRYLEEQINTDSTAQALTMRSQHAGAACGIRWGLSSRELVGLRLLLYLCWDIWDGLRDVAFLKVCALPIQGGARNPAECKVHLAVYIVLQCLELD